MEVEQSSDPGLAHRRPPPIDADEPFRQSLADLSRQLASRTPPEPPAYDPKLEAELAPEPKEPAWRWRPRPYLALLALIAGAGLAALIHVMLNATMSEPTQAPHIAVVAPPLPDPVPAPTEADLATPKRAAVDPPPPQVAPVVVAAPQPAPPKGKLEAYEIMEIQTRLKAAGVDPGPLDGMPGGQTTGAIKQYQASKAQPQTGKLDRDLLKQLRREADRAQQ
jgi:Putative peptidoglycan binding domain